MKMKFCRRSQIVILSLVLVFIFAGYGWFHHTSPRLVERNSVITIEGRKIKNMRDLGGMRVGERHRIRKGMIYRSGAFNSAGQAKDEDGWIVPERSRTFLVNQLGIKTDLDLRGHGNETEGMKSSPLGDGVKWIHIPSRTYGDVISTLEGREAFVKAFRIFLDLERYPIVVHCQHGRDRAGTLIFLLEALLGMSDEMLYRDYAFSWIDSSDQCDATKYNKLINEINAYTGSGLADRTVAFARSLGITDSEIAHFKALVLEP